MWTQWTLPTASVLPPRNFISVPALSVGRVWKAVSRGRPVSSAPPSPSRANMVRDRQRDHPFPRVGSPSVKRLCEVAVGPSGHSSLQLPHPGVWSIEARQNGSPWGSAVPEAAQPQPLPRSWHGPRPYLQAQSQLEQRMSQTWETLGGGHA